MGTASFSAVGRTVREDGSASIYVPEFRSGGRGPSEHGRIERSKNVPPRVFRGSALRHGRGTRGYRAGMGPRDGLRPGRAQADDAEAIRNQGHISFQGVQLKLEKGWALQTKLPKGATYDKVLKRTTSPHS